MANCRKCGRWAGLVGGDECDDCKRRPEGFEAPAPVAPTDVDELIVKLRPLLHSAATRAGVVAAFTLTGICFALGLVYAFFSAMTSSPSPR